MAETNGYNSPQYSPLAGLLSPLSNASSWQIIKRLSLKRIFVRYSGDASLDDEKNQDVIIALQENGLLISGKPTR